MALFDGLSVDKKNKLCDVAQRLNQPPWLDFTAQVTALTGNTTILNLGTFIANLLSFLFRPQKWAIRLAFNPPDLLAENQEAWYLWQAVKTQWRSGLVSLIGLDYTAVIKVAAILPLDLTPGILRKIQLLEYYTLTSQKE